MDESQYQARFFVCQAPRTPQLVNKFTAETSTNEDALKACNNIVTLRAACPVIDLFCYSRSMFVAATRQNDVCDVPQKFNRR